MGRVTVGRTLNVGWMVLRVNRTKSMRFVHEHRLRGNDGCHIRIRRANGGNEAGKWGNESAKHTDERLPRGDPSVKRANGAGKHGNGVGILVFGRRILVDS